MYEGYQLVEFDSVGWHGFGVAVGEFSASQPLWDAVLVAEGFLDAGFEGDDGGASGADFENVADF